MDSDEELYARARQGDVAAIDGLYSRYARRLYGFILRFLNDRAEAEEVFHDGFLGVVRGPELRFDEARFASWLFRVARNLSANRLRSHLRGWPPPPVGQKTTYGRWTAKDIERADRLRKDPAAELAADAQLRAAYNLLHMQR